MKEETFNKKTLQFFLPKSFKGLTQEYILDCIFDNDIQIQWTPKVGDIIVGSTGNIFVVSGEHKIHESIGGAMYFFGGGLCNRDGGITLNDTQCYVMNKEGKVPESSFWKGYISSFSDFRFVPYPHELALLRKNN